MKLNEISRAPRDAEKLNYDAELTAFAVERMVQAHPLLGVLEFFQIQGNAEEVRKASTASTGNFRALNADYADANTNPEYQTATLRIFGGRYRVDQAYVRRALDIPSLILSDVSNLAMNAAYELVDQLFNATSSATSFAGIKSLTPASQTLALGANGDTLDTTAKQTAFFRKLDELIMRVRPQNRVIVASAGLISVMMNAYRTAFNYVTAAQSGIGVPMLQYNGIPVVPAGQDKDGNEILPANETKGTSNDCQSLYVISAGERSNYSIATSSGMGVFQNKVGIATEIIVEGDFAPVLLDNKALGRLEGIRI